MPTSRASAPACGTTRGSIGSTSSVNDIAMFCSTENASIRMPRAVTMPTPIERLQPGVAVGDGAGVLPEHDHVAFIRQRRAGDEVHERFGRDRVEAGDRHDRARRHGQLANAQRPQRPGSPSPGRGSRAATSCRPVAPRQPGAPSLGERGEIGRPAAVSAAERQRSPRATCCAGSVAFAEVGSVAVKIRSAGDEHAEPRRQALVFDRRPRACDRSDRPRSHRGRDRRAAESARRASSRRDARTTRRRRRRGSSSITSAGLGPVRGTKAGRPVASHRSNASCTDAT